LPAACSLCVAIGIEEYFYLMTWLTAMAAMILTEAIVFLLPDVRTAYSVIPSVSFFFFFFSGIIVKPGVLAAWLAPWLPSVSVIRWIAQGLTLNEFDTNDDAFPDIPGPNGGYSSWEGFLNLFGWGGKSKWLCTSYLLYNIAGFRIVQLLASVYLVMSQRGRRGLRKGISEDRMY
jgi:hypothetical protein